MRNTQLYIKDILDSINSIETFVKGMDFNTFKNDDLVSSAVIRKFEIIGEAVKHIPNEMRIKYPEIPWKEIAGFCDKLIHFYFGIKYDMIWNTIKKLPE
jgi:uncharacterized protein with HEPN domain